MQRILFTIKSTEIPGKAKRSIIQEVIEIKLNINKRFNNKEDRWEYYIEPKSFLDKLKVKLSYIPLDLSVLFDDLFYEFHYRKKRVINSGNSDSLLKNALSLKYKLLCERNFKIYEPKYFETFQEAEQIIEEYSRGNVREILNKEPFPLFRIRLNDISAKMNVEEFEVLQYD